MSRFIVGLTGGIGSGKSTVAEAFVALGAALVDTDQIAHQLTAPGGMAMPALQATFGPAVVTRTGALDRVAMRQLVFSDSQAKSRLENILHPLIRQISSERCLTADSPYVILAVPLLVESASYRRFCQRILVVDCQEICQIKRVMQRSGLTALEVEKIMQSQASRAMRLAVADDVINNDGDRQALLPQVAKLHGDYLQRAAEKPQAKC